MLVNYDWDIDFKDLWPFLFAAISVVVIYGQMCPFRIETAMTGHRWWGYHSGTLAPLPTPCSQFQLQRILFKIGHGDDSPNATFPIIHEVLCRWYTIWSCHHCWSGGSEDSVLWKFAGKIQDGYYSVYRDIWYSTNMSLLEGKAYPNSKVHGANMRPTWVLSAPDGPHVGPMNFVIRDMHLDMSATMPHYLMACLGLLRYPKFDCTWDATSENVTLRDAIVLHDNASQ